MNTPGITNEVEELLTLPEADAEFCVSQCRDDNSSG